MRLRPVPLASPWQRMADAQLVARGHVRPKAATWEALDMTDAQVQEVAEKAELVFPFWATGVRHKLARRIRCAGYVPTPENIRRVHEALTG